jgi:hypothetical protein
MRAGKFAEARPYFSQSEQEVLDQYLDLVRKGGDSHTVKATRADALWKAAQLIADKGDKLFDYALPAAMAGRLAGREVEPAEVAFSGGKISYGDRMKDVPPVTEAEKKRLKTNIATTLHRYHAYYVAADLGWRAAQLMPDQEEQTAKVLNTAGSWLKNGDDKAADRFYQAIERRCANTEIGEEAIKRHWFVDTPETNEDSDSAPEPQQTPEER